MTRFISVLSRAMMALGVLAATTAPTRPSNARPGIESASATVGMSGIVQRRLELITASARNLPLRMFGIADEFRS